jgi:hypothetical protein
MKARYEASVIPSKALFLDLDGVINTNNREDKHSRLHSDSSRDSYLPRCVEALNKCCEDTGCAIVITSAWRKNYKQFEDMLLDLRGIGLRGNIVGNTGSCSGCRGAEIRQWIQHFCPSDFHDYVIVDDETTDMLLYQQPHIVKCDMFCGFIESTGYKVGRVLNKLF